MAFYKPPHLDLRCLQIALHVFSVCALQVLKLTYLFSVLGNWGVRPSVQLNPIPIYSIHRSTVKSGHFYGLTHFTLETPKGVLAKSADPDQMPHNVASDLGLHYFASCSTIFQQKYLN